MGTRLKIAQYTFFVKTCKIQNHALLLSAVNFIWFWDRVMLVWEIDTYSIVRRVGKYDNLKWFLAFLLQFLLLLYEGMPLAFESFFTLLLSFNLVFLTNASRHLKRTQNGTNIFWYKIAHNKLKFCLKKFLFYIQNWPTISYAYNVVLTYNDIWTLFFAWGVIIRFIIYCWISFNLQWRDF